MWSKRPWNTVSEGSWMVRKQVGPRAMICMRREVRGRSGQAALASSSPQLPVSKSRREVVNSRARASRAAMALRNAGEVRLRWTWRALRRAGLVPVRRQFEVPGVMRVDFAWPERKVALHVDSAAWHAQSQRRTRDAIQRNQLQALGWYSSVVTHAMLQNDAWLDTLKRALELRSPQRRLGLSCTSLT